MFMSDALYWNNSCNMAVESVKFLCSIDYKNQQIDQTTPLFLSIESSQIATEANKCNAKQMVHTFSSTYHMPNISSICQHIEDSCAA